MPKSTTGSGQWLFLACKVKTGDPMSKLVLIALADRADDKGQCWPAISTIADDCECSESTVKRSLNKLEKQGHIARINRANDGMKTSNLYRITLDRSERPYDGSERSSSRVTVTHKTPNETHNKINKDNPYVEFADFMAGKVREVSKTKRAINTETWAKSIRLLVEKDERPLDLITQVFLWANSHQFWKSNILSAPKLREKFDQLYVQWEASNENPRNGVQPNQDTRRLSPGERVRQRRAEAAERQSRATN